MTDLHIPYSPSTLGKLFGGFLGLAALAFFGTVAALMGHASLTNDRDLVLNGIELSATSATILYAIVGIAALCFVLIGLRILLGLLRGETSSKEVVLSSTHISAPTWVYSKKVAKVAYASISAIRAQGAGLHIQHTGGRLSIPTSMIPDKKVFADLVSELRARVQATRE